MAVFKLKNFILNFIIFRIHVDNMIVVNAFRNHRGKSPLINDVIKRLIEWEIFNNCRIEIEYVRSKENLADGPSRHLHYDDELCIA